MPAQHQKAISPDFVPITDSRLLEERLKVATDVEGLVPLYVACEQKLAPDRLWSQIDFTVSARQTLGNLRDVFSFLFSWKRVRTACCSQSRR